MNLRLHYLQDRRQRSRWGYTLVEMVFAAGIYMFILVGVVVAIQIFALRIYTLAATKLTATQGSRQALNQIRDDIRSGKLLQVGTTDNSGNFTAVYGTNGAVGNALQIFETTNQGVPYSIYYLQTNQPGGVSSNNLIWISVNASSVSTTVNLATYITNTDIFAAESWDNWPTVAAQPMQPTTNNVCNNQVYSVKLQFYQWEYPIAVVGGSGANSYDYYQLRTRVCRRALD
jgi:type II secretory pathway pseudopilin PulG